MKSERYPDVRSVQDRSPIGRCEAVVERVLREYVSEHIDAQALRSWVDERGCGLRAVASS
jgi:hypothetical protein